MASSTTPTNLTTPTVSIEDYLPDPATIPFGNILATRQMLASYLAGWYPDLDIRPGSVSGDLQVTPLSVMMASEDIALSSILADLDLANVAAGNVNNSTFVQAYLTNFGAISNQMVTSTGVVKFSFNSNQAYAFSNASQILFGSQYFSLAINQGNPIIVYPTGTQGQPNVLTRVAQNQYDIYFPVYGVSGASVSDGTPATTSIVIPQLISITAVGDFDPGQPADTVVSLAQKASTTFYSATLTTRSGAIAFLARQFPGLLGSSVVITGDTEMIRDAVNPLGIHTGEVDIFAKSQTAYANGQQAVTLTYNNLKNCWNGLLNLPVVPAFFDFGNSVFYVGNYGQSNSPNALYSASNNVNYDNIGISFSNQEVLGLTVQASNPGNVQNQSVSVYTNAPGTLIVDGVYNGYIFDSQSTRSVAIVFTGTGSTTVNGNTYATATATATDQSTGIVIPVAFVANNTANPTVGIATQDYNYNAFFGGLTIEITIAGAFVPDNLLNQTYVVVYSGRTADFTLNYQYDPSLVSIDSTVNNTDNAPVGVDILTRSFIPCYVAALTVNYRAPFGTTVNTANAQTSIINYVNSIAYPDIYEDSAISQIMIANGATGVTSIQKSGIVYPSLASTFVQNDGTQVSVPRLVTNDLSIPANSWGIGPRNVTYILPYTNITFNVTSF
jgi:hypothetical protein